MYQPLLTRKGSQESKNWKKMFRMNTRVLKEHVIFVELLLLIVITWFWNSPSTRLSLDMI